MTAEHGEQKRLAGWSWPLFAAVVFILRSSAMGTLTPYTNTILSQWFFRRRGLAAQEAEVFSQFDCDGSGRITLSDTQEALKQLGVFDNVMENKNVFFENILTKVSPAGGPG